MSKAVITNNQPSITEWFAAMGDAKKADELREEDNRKHKRLEHLYQKIGLQYERPEKWDSLSLFNKNPEVVELLNSRGDELCAFRLVPKDDKVKKLRNRGLNIRDTLEWFLKLDIDPKDYDVYICPHSEVLLWSMTFVVSPDLIFGEVIRGLHSQLTHGETKEKLIQFRYDFKKWEWSERDKEAEKVVKEAIKKLKVADKPIQEDLKKDLKAGFSHDHLTGYFEVTVWPGNKIYFIDYSRVLSKYIKVPPTLDGKFSNSETVEGVSANAGKVKGTVRIINENNINRKDFSKGDILVCDNTDVRYVPLMKKAGAIITSRGGLLSHAAIVARELKSPCIIGAKNASKVLKDGMIVEVDADKGVVRIIK